MLFANATRHESAKPGSKLIGKNSIHMKRRSEHPEAQWPVTQKASLGGASQIFAEGQQTVYTRQANGVFNLKSPQLSVLPLAAGQSTGQLGQSSPAHKKVTSILQDGP